jgi:hypothetical protein
MRVANKPALAWVLLAGLLAPVTGAQAYNVTLTFTNLSGDQGPAFSPFFVALHDGSYDPFNTGATASGAIESVAELGDGSGLSADFTGAHPNGVSATAVATVNPFGPGIYLPGSSGSVTLDLDPVNNRYLSYFAMVVPSNDRFIGNDSPTSLALFDGAGNFTGGNFVSNGDSIWDAGTELDGTAGAAFLDGSTATDSPAQGGVIGLNDDFSVYSGLLTPAGYNFTDLPGAGTPLLQIDAAASVVPLPAAVWLFGGTLPILLGRLRRKGPTVAV